MKIEVRKITESGFCLERKIPAADWNLDGFDLKFIDFIQLKGVVKRDSQQIVSKVWVRAKRQINCSRCLVEACQVKEFNFQRKYPLDQLSDFLSIEEDIREEILLNFPLKVLCSRSCSGLCFRCGQNLNWGECGCSG